MAIRPGPSQPWAPGDLLVEDELNVKRVVRAPAGEASRYSGPDWVLREDDGRPVAALPARPTEALLEEGLAREVGRRLQQTRKELGLRYTEGVEVTIGASGPVHRAVAARRAGLARDLIAEPLVLVEGMLPDGPGVRTWDLDGFAFSARVVRRPA